MALKIAVLCAAAALITTGIRTIKPEIALAVSLTAGAAACLLSMNELKTISALISESIPESGISAGGVPVILKAAGISVAGEYASQICRDAGEGALAQRIDFAVRITLLALAAPLIREILKLLPEFVV